MNLSEFSVKRPVTIFMLFLGIVVIGFISLTRLPVELLPNTSFQDISIFIDIRGGMPPVEVENLVAKPVEEAVATVSHLNDIISISEEGRCRIILKFEPGIDMDYVAVEVREMMSRIKDKLPPEIEKPVIAKFEQSDVPIVNLAVTGAGYTPEKLRRIVDEDIKDALSRVNGVANIEIGGGRERKILVEIKQQALETYNVPISKVINALGLSNLNLLAGEFEGSKDRYLIRIMGEFADIEQIKQLPIAVTEDRATLRLLDVADIKDSYLEARSYARINAVPIVSIYIQKESQANTIEVTNGILKQLEKVKKALHLEEKGIKIVPTYNQADSIRRAIDSVNQSLITGAILACLVLLFFLRNWRGLLIICINIPVCVMATFAMMFLVPQKVTLNVMTLSGLALGVGMLVDNSIVVLENIHQVKNRFPSTQEAAIKGTSAMTLAIVASTVTTVAVFLPIVFVNKQIRLLYSGVATTVTFSLLASLFAALTLTPMIFARFSKERISEKREPGYLKKMRVQYRSTLAKSIRNRKGVIAIVMCVFLISVLLLVKFVEKEFIGATQQEDFTIFVELPTGAKLDISDKAVSEIEKALSGVKEIKNVTARVEPWSSKVYVKLVPLKDRRRSATEVINSLRPKVKDVENKFREAFIYFEEPEQVETNEVLIEVYGYDYQVLNKLAIKLISSMEKVKGLTDLKIRWRKGRPEWKIVIDKEKAAYFGLTTQDVSEILHTQTRGLRATLFHTQAKQIEVIGRLRLEDRQSIEQIKKLVIVLPDSRKIYLEQIANFIADTGPGKIWRRNKNRMIQVSANRGKYAFGTAVEKIKDAIKDVEFPKDYYYRFGENYQRMLENQSQLTFVLAIVLILTFLILASLFASYSQPFIIMATVPLAIIGTAFALFVTRKPINVGVLMGFIILGGIVVNNAIVMVDHMNTLKAKGFKILKVIIQGAVDRLRPVLMTSTTTILGLIPLALDRSEESALWSPLAITVIGGMLTSTVLTLFVVPSIYLYFEEARNWKWGNKSF